MARYLLLSLALFLFAAPSFAGGSQWQKNAQGWPVLTSPCDSGLLPKEILHRARLKKVEADIAGFDGGVRVLNKGPDSNQVHDTSYKQRGAARAIDLSRWSDVLRVDAASMVVHAEPMVKMQALVEATLKHGMLPRVLPEFKHITVGGAIMGAALESSSHMHGDFLDGCRAVELLLGDGSVAWCSRTERTDLFDALSGSYGTLGLLLSAQIECQPAFPFLEIKYRLYPSVDQGIAALEELCGPVGRGSGSSRAPFVDALGLQLRPSSDVKYSHVLVMTADYPNATPPNRPQLQHAAAPNATSKPHSNQESTPTPPRRVALDKPWGLWFFEHAYRVAARLESLDAHHQAFADQQDRSVQDLHTSEGSSVRAHGGGWGKGDSVHVAEVSEITEMAETASYLFRYDYGAFWMARPMRCMSPHTKLSLPLLGLFLASSPYLRWCLGWLFSTARLFRLLKLAPRDIVAQKMIILDAYIPAKNAGSFIKTIDAHVPISTALWLCPVAPPLRPLLLAPHGQAKSLMINVGVYGRVCDELASSYSRQVEEEVAKVGGRKMLYSHNFYTHTQFWGREGPFQKTMPSESHYLKLRKKYGAEGVYMSLFDKVCEKARSDTPMDPATRPLSARISRSLASYLL